jgi:molybdate transport system substrate-binding protein
MVHCSRKDADKRAPTGRAIRVMSMTASPPIEDAPEMLVLCAGAMHPILGQLTGALERVSGKRVAVRFASSAQVKARVLNGEPADVVITTSSAIDELSDQQKILPGTATALARSAIGMAVRAGAARPDIGSVESFKAALRNARSIAIADPVTGSPSGNHLVKMLERLAMTAELESSIMRVGGGAGGVVVVGEAVAQGEAEIGLQQIAEILAVPGIDLVGELPSELQHVTVFSAAVAAATTDPPSACRAIEFLASSTVASLINAGGMEAVHHALRNAAAHHSGRQAPTS